MTQVQEYLKGNFSKQNLYSTYYLLAKYWKEQGQSAAEIRKSIFDWANKHGLFVKYKLNVLIIKVFSDNKKISDGTIAYVNNEDIDRIKTLFDSKKTRLTALAILCYAKIYANANREFSISSCSLGAWINIYHTNLRDRYIKELCLFDYLTKLEVPKNDKNWNKRDLDKSTSYRINFPIKNIGEYKLELNDIEKLYNEVF